MLNKNLYNFIIKLTCYFQMLHLPGNKGDFLAKIVAKKKHGAESATSLDSLCFAVYIGLFWIVQS